MAGSHDDFEEKKDASKSTDQLSKTPPLSDKSPWFLSTSHPTTKPRRASLGSAALMAKRSTDLPSLNQDKNDRAEEDAVASPKKASPHVGDSPRKDIPLKESHSPRTTPRKDTPRKDKESPRNKEKSSPRLLWLSHSPSRSASPSPRLIYNTLPISDDEISDCIERAEALIKKQTKSGFKNIFMNPEADGACGVYMPANERYGVILARASARSSWKFFLIEKIFLLVDESKKIGYQEDDIRDKTALIGRGNEGLVVTAWDLQPREISGEMVREKIAAKIHHLKSTNAAALNEQLILTQLDQFYGRFDYIYNSSGTEIEALTQETHRSVHKKVILMKFLPGKRMMMALYKMNMEKGEDDPERYIAKLNLTPFERVKMGLEYIRAARILQEHNITHRDLKPDNALIDEQGTVRFADFSSAMLTTRITGKESLAGTFPFNAPELDKTQNKQIKNFSVADNYPTGISLMEIVSTGNTRPIMIGMNKPGRESPQLLREELSTVIPDLLYPDSIANLEERLQKFIDSTDKEQEGISADIILQDLIYKSCGRSKFLKVMFSLTKLNPDDRMKLEDAELEWGRAYQEMLKKHNVFMSLFEAKKEAKKQLAPLSSDLLNKAIDKMADIEQASEEMRAKKRSRTRLTHSSSSSGTKSTASSKDESPPPSPTRF